MTCKIKWCVALVQESSDVCALHAKYPKLRTEELTDDDREQVEAASVAVIQNGLAISPFVLSFVLAQQCEYCDGEGKCETCHGTGQHACYGCDRDHECGHCDGTGDCECRMKKDLRPVVDHPESWRWTPEYVAEVAKTLTKPTGRR